MYDAIVVGARCAGAPVAMLLARAGRRVLLLDRDAFPSDIPLSTHLIWQRGAESLERWGLLENLERTGCPPMRHIALDLGGFTLHGRAPAADGVASCYAPRRYVLDSLLVDAAVAAGAELRRGTVTSLVLQDGAVAGIRYDGENGAGFEERAPVVIGADGMNSSVAQMAHAGMVVARPKLAGVLFSYFERIPGKGPAFYARPGRMFFSWLTNDGLTLAGVCCRYDAFRPLAAEPDQQFFAEIGTQAPPFAERLRAGKQVAPCRHAALPNFCRESAGRGWALAGDAGMTMDPITAAGITNAFRDAELLAETIVSGAPLDEYDRGRRQASMPIFEFTCDTARLDPPTPQVIDLMLALREDPEAVNDYFGVFAQTVPVEAWIGRCRTILGRPADGSSVGLSHQEEPLSQGAQHDTETVRQKPSR